MNAAELIEKLKFVISESFDDSIHEFTDVEYLNEEYVSIEERDNDENAVNDRFALKTLGAFEQVQSKRLPGKDVTSGWDIMRYVYHFKDHDIYLAIDGNYSSWTGTEFQEDWYQVKPEKVTTIRYKAVK